MVFKGKIIHIYSVSKPTHENKDESENDNFRIPIETVSNVLEEKSKKQKKESKK